MHPGTHLLEDRLGVVGRLGDVGVDAFVFGRHGGGGSRVEVKNMSSGAAGRDANSFHAMRRLLALSAAIAFPAAVFAQRAPRVYTHADTIRGSNGPGRVWWDAQFFD